MTASYVLPARARAKPREWEWMAVGTLTFLFSLSCFVPWQPFFVRSSDLDDSWMLAFNAVFRTGMQFGKDIIFTFGPWGFINTRCYHPNTWGWMLAAWTFVAVAFWRTCWEICRQHRLRPAIALLWLTAVTGFAAMGTEHVSSTLLCLIGLMPVYYFFCRGNPFSLTWILLVSAAALAGLVKFTYLFAAILVLAPISVDQIRRRQWPSILLMFSAGFLGLYLLAGQQMSSLWPYLRLSWHVADWYTDAMSFTPGAFTPGNYTVATPFDLILFIAAALLLVLVVFMATTQRRKWESLLPAISLSGLVFVIFKWGFVRHEGQHTALAGLALLVLALLCWPFLRENFPGRKWALRRISLLVICVLVCWQSVQSSTGLSLPTYFVGSLLTPVPANVAAASRIFSRQPQLANEYVSALQEIRDSSPLPPLRGTTDIYPWNQASLIAYGATYNPRPIFQSYAAYSPELARINAGHLVGEAAPDTLLFSVRTGGTALRHFPPTDDSLSWPLLLSKYDLRASSGDFLVLQKSSTPGNSALTPISQTDVAFGETIPVPSTAAGPVWVQIAIKPTVSGKLLSFLYKNPELYLKIGTTVGKPRTYRLVAGQAQAGFLLSPAIDDNAAFAALARQEPLADREVTTITLSDRAWIGATWAYRPAIQVCFSRLQLERSPRSP